VIWSDSSVGFGGTLHASELRTGGRLFLRSGIIVGIGFLLVCGFRSCFLNRSSLLLFLHSNDLTDIPFYAFVFGPRRLATAEIDDILVQQFICLLGSLVLADLLVLGPHVEEAVVNALEGTKILRLLLSKSLILQRLALLLVLIGTCIRSSTFARVE